MSRFKNTKRRSFPRKINPTSENTGWQQAIIVQIVEVGYQPNEYSKYSATNTLAITFQLRDGQKIIKPIAIRKSKRSFLYKIVTSCEGNSIESILGSQIAINIQHKWNEFDITNFKPHWKFEQGRHLIIDHDYPFY